MKLILLFSCAMLMSLTAFALPPACCTSQDGCSGGQCHFKACCAAYGNAPGGGSGMHCGTAGGGSWCWGTNLNVRSTNPRSQQRDPIQDITGLPNKN